MQKFLALLACAIALAASHASAADLRFPPPGPGYPAYPPPTYLPALPQWTGCYVGANIGGAWAILTKAALSVQPSPHTRLASPAAAKPAAICSSIIGCSAFAT